MNDVTLLIDGKSVNAKNGRTFERIDPIKRNVATRAAAATVADVELAVKSSAAAFESWGATAPGRRRELLLRAAEVLLSHQAEFVRYMIAETGATEGWAAFNVAIGAALFREAA